MKMLGKINIKKLAVYIGEFSIPDNIIQDVHPNTYLII